MTEQEINITGNTLPDSAEEPKETTPDTASEIKIPVKFNKETKELSLEEATTLAQKGLKFESIEDDYNRLRELALKENKSVPIFISELKNRFDEDKKHSLMEKCGGNEEIAEHILRLEGSATADSGLDELTALFPEIKSADDLPDEVLQRSQLKGTLLLDEYLRYLLTQKRNADLTAKKQKDGVKSSTGSLYSSRGGHNSETEEFLKGLWK